MIYYLNCNQNCKNVFLHNYVHLYDHIPFCKFHNIHELYFSLSIRYCIYELFHNYESFLREDKVKYIFFHKFQIIHIFPGKNAFPRKDVLLRGHILKSKNFYILMFFLLNNILPCIDAVLHNYVPFLHVDIPICIYFYNF